MPRKRRREHRRRKWARPLTVAVLPAVLCAAVVALVVGAVAEIGPASGPYRRTIDRGYAALASSVSVETNGTGKALGSFVVEAPRLGRLRFFSTLDALAAQAGSQAEELERASPPTPDAGAGTSCVSALTARASAVATIRRTLQGLLGGSTGRAVPIAMGSASSDLDSAASTLMQADALWVACRRALRRAPGTPVLSVSRWITDAALWRPFSLAELVDEVVSSPTLVAQPALDVTAIDVVPAPLPGSGTVQVPTTNQLTVHVDVSNAGNVDEPGIAVRAVLTGPSRATPLSAIVAIGTGRSLTVVLGPFAVAPGSAYSLDVSVAPPSGPGGSSTAMALEVLSVPTTTTTSTTTVANTTTSTRPGDHSTTTAPHS